MIDLLILGLCIILISWIVQLINMNKRRELSKPFLVTYIIGILFLVLDNYNIKQLDIAILNALIMVTVAGVLFKYSKPKA